MSEKVQANGQLVTLYVERNITIRNKGDVKAANARIDKFVVDNKISDAVRRASSRAASNVQTNNKGGMAHKAKMAKGGMANGKQHMYVAGGVVKDNPGLRALRASGTKGMEAYKNITGN
jgi:hypothetical protein